MIVIRMVIRQRTKAEYDVLKILDMLVTHHLARPEMSESMAITMVYHGGWNCREQESMLSRMIRKQDEP